MGARDRLFSLLAAQAEACGFTERAEGVWGTEFQRRVTHGVLSLIYRAVWQRRSWRIRLSGRMTYQLPSQGGEIRVVFPSSPDWLDAAQPHEWLLVPHATEEGIHRIAAEIEASYARTLLPFLNQVSAPEGLLAFMMDINQPLKLLIAGPWPSGPFRRAAVVFQTLLPPNEAAAALAQLETAKLAFRARWEARGT